MKEIGYCFICGTTIETTEAKTKIVDGLHVAVCENCWQLKRRN